MNYIQTVLPNMASHIRCHDHLEPLSGIKLPRGRGGVAILWPDMWSSRIRHLDEGSELLQLLSPLLDPFVLSMPICLLKIPAHK